MKKLFFIMAMSVCAFTAQAQTTSGIRVGLNMTGCLWGIWIRFWNNPIRRCVSLENRKFMDIAVWPSCWLVVWM